MAIVIEFEDLAEARRRRQQRASLVRCVEIIELNLEHALWMVGRGPLDERPLYAHRVQTLSALRDYAVRVL
jgi:hypothetical protein